MSWGSSSRFFSSPPLGSSTFSTPSFSSIGRHDDLRSSFRKSETRWSPSSLFSRSSASRANSSQSSDWRSTSSWSSRSSGHSSSSFMESLDSIERIFRLTDDREDTRISSSLRKKPRWSFPSFSFLKSKALRRAYEDADEDEDVQDDLDSAITEENKRNEELAEMMMRHEEDEAADESETVEANDDDDQTSEQESIVDIEAELLGIPREEDDHGEKIEEEVENNSSDSKSSFLFDEESYYGDIDETKALNVINNLVQGANIKNPPNPEESKDSDVDKISYPIKKPNERDKGNNVKKKRHRSSRAKRHKKKETTDNSKTSEDSIALNDPDKTSVHHADPDIKNYKERDKDIVSPCGGQTDGDHATPRRLLLRIEDCRDIDDIAIDPSKGTRLQTSKKNNPQQTVTKALPRDTDEKFIARYVERDKANKKPRSPQTVRLKQDNTNTAFTPELPTYSSSADKHHDKRITGSMQQCVERDKLAAILKSIHIGYLASGVNSFLRTVILVLMMVACNSLSTGNDFRPSYQLWQGENATIQFQIQHPPGPISNPTFIMYYDSIGIPFCRNGQLLREGLKHESQIERFNIASSVSHGLLSVNLSISHVSRYDEGIVVLKFTVFESNLFFQATVNKSIRVRMPPGKAKCYITDSEFRHLKSLNCHAPCDDGSTDLACYQEKQKLPLKNKPVQDRVAVRAVFWMDPYNSVCCCATDVSQNVTYDSCLDYKWAPMFEDNPNVRSPRPSTDRPKSSEDIAMTIPPLESSANALNEMNAFFFFTSCILLQFIV